MEDSVVPPVDLACVVWRERPDELERYGAAVRLAWERLPAERRGTGILVENGARPGAGDEAAAQLEAATGSPPRRLAFERNRGPARAYNAALAEATAPYLALLDSDGAPDPPLLARLAGALDERSDALVAAGEVIPFAAAAPPAGPTVEAEWVSAGASLYRAAALRELGGFDELFAWSCEEMDLGYRARTAGWRCLRVPGAAFRHEIRHKASARRSRRYTEAVMAWRHVHFPRRVAAKAWVMQFPQLAAVLRHEGVASAAGGLLGLVTYVRLVPACERRRR